MELLKGRQFQINRRLDRDFYAPRMEWLAPALQEMLEIAGRCVHYPPLRIAEIQDLTWRSPANVRQLLGRLVNEGALYRRRPGEFEYSAPGFHGYLLRRRLDYTSSGS